MSLLRLAQGRIDLALPAIRRALDEAPDPIARSRLLLALLVRRIRSVAFPGLPRRVPVRHRAGNVGDVAPVPWVENARLRPSNYAHARTGVKRPETLCVAPASGDDIADVPHL